MRCIEIYILFVSRAHTVDVSIRANMCLQLIQSRFKFKNIQQFSSPESLQNNTQNELCVLFRQGVSTHDWLQTNSQSKETLVLHFVWRLNPTHKFPNRRHAGESSSEYSPQRRVYRTTRRVYQQLSVVRGVPRQEHFSLGSSSDGHWEILHPAHPITAHRSKRSTGFIVFWPLFPNNPRVQLEILRSLPALFFSVTTKTQLS